MSNVRTLPVAALLYTVVAILAAFLAFEFNVGGALVLLFAAFALAVLATTWAALRSLERAGTIIRYVARALRDGEVVAASGAHLEHSLILVGDDGATTPTLLAFTVEYDDVRERIAPWTAAAVEHSAGVFTALGILFTFVGLITGLAELDPGGDSNQLQSGIGQLVNGLGVAFFSSVVGISLSLATLVATRIQAADLRAACADLRDTAQSVCPEFAPNLLEFETLQETRRLVALAEDQKVAMNQLASDVAGQVSAQLGEIIHQSVGEPLEALQLTMTEFASKDAEAHASALSGVMEAFSTTFTERLAAHFRELETVLRDLAAWHEATHERHKQTWEQLAAHVDAHAEQMAQERSLLRERTELEERLLAARAEQDQRLGAVIQSLAGTAHDLAQFESLLTRAIEGQREATAHLTGVASSLSEESQKVAEGAELLRRAIDDAARPLVDQYERLIGQVQSQLREALTDSFRSFDAEMARVVSHLSGTFAQLQDTLDRIDKSTGRVANRTAAQ